MSRIKRPRRRVQSARKRNLRRRREFCKRWEQKKKKNGRKWRFLEHNGPLFPSNYERLPRRIKFFYDGKEMHLTEKTEEVATFYARMLNHDYTRKKTFNKNFFSDWRKVMTGKERARISNISKCNFKYMHRYFLEQTDERKTMSSEDKKKIKKLKEKLEEKYGFCMCDGHKEKIENFKIEPPGLFRGRGNHPKMGKLKKRVQPEDVIINCSKNSAIPKAPKGHKWKEVRHDQNVVWLDCWKDNIQGQMKYVMLNCSSKLRVERDWEKYETARQLGKRIKKIRAQYRADLRSNNTRNRQRAVALYFIDKLALRSGNEKDSEQADTVGCCSLRVEHLRLHERKNGKRYVIVFDFLGKDSIRYHNEVSVDKYVFRNLQHFRKNKCRGDPLFDMLNTSDLNSYLNKLMKGLTAKVFRTCNASITLQKQLKNLTRPKSTTAEKILAYNRANRAVAILCNHQKTVPKTHANSVRKLRQRIKIKSKQLKKSEIELKLARRKYRNQKSVTNENAVVKKQNTVNKIEEQLTKLEIQLKDKEENKKIDLGTSKLNYLDPRITVAWCKKFRVPIEKIYSKKQRNKFSWAMDKTGPNFVF